MRPSRDGRNRVPTPFRFLGQAGEDGAIPEARSRAEQSQNEPPAVSKDAYAVFARLLKDKDEQIKSLQDCQIQTMRTNAEQTRDLVRRNAALQKMLTAAQLQVKLHRHSKAQHAALLDVLQKENKDLKVQQLYDAEKIRELEDSLCGAAEQIAELEDELAELRQSATDEQPKKSKKPATVPAARKGKNAPTKEARSSKNATEATHVPAPSGPTLHNARTRRTAAAQQRSQEPAVRGTLSIREMVMLGETISIAPLHVKLERSTQVHETHVDPLTPQSNGLLIVEGSQQGSPALDGPEGTVHHNCSEQGPQAADMAADMAGSNDHDASRRRSDRTRGREKNYKEPPLNTKMRKS